MARVGKGEHMAHNKPITITDLKKKKRTQEKIVMITAYDFPSAKLADQAGVDLILVGDSLGMVVLGYDTTLPVTVDDMVHHTKAVTRGTNHAFVVTDLPFLSYHGAFEQTLKNAGRMIQEGSAKAVKLEGGREMADTIQKLTQAGIPVMGHIGLTPQSVNQLGGFKVQGKDQAAAKRLIEDAKILEEAGCFAIVLECIPGALSDAISKELTIPTIGIGAGVHCDGQVLVYHDILGYGSEHIPKFVKKYTEIGDQIGNAIRNYCTEVRNGSFPQEEHTYSVNDSILTGLYGDGEKK